MSETIHELLPEGESTAKWAIRSPGFLGSIKQVLRCARCGDTLRGGPNARLHYRDFGKPSLHVLCHDCHEALPDNAEQTQPAVSESRGDKTGPGLPQNPSNGEVL